MENFPEALRLKTYSATRAQIMMGMGMVQRRCVCSWWKRGIWGSKRRLEVALSTDLVVSIVLLEILRDGGEVSAGVTEEGRELPHARRVWTPRREER